MARVFVPCVSSVRAKQPKISMRCAASTKCACLLVPVWRGTHSVCVWAITSCHRYTCTRYLLLAQCLQTSESAAPAWPTETSHTPPARWQAQGPVCMVQRHVRQPHPPLAHTRRERVNDGCHHHHHTHLEWVSHDCLTVHKAILIDATQLLQCQLLHLRATQLQLCQGLLKEWVLGQGFPHTDSEKKGARLENKTVVVVQQATHLSLNFTSSSPSQSRRSRHQSNDALRRYSSSGPAGSCLADLS